jgi:purine-cytosine permease-like protein
MIANFMNYFLFFSGAVIGWIVVLVTMYWIYRRGIAIRLTLLLMSCVTIVGCRTHFDWLVYDDDPANYQSHQANGNGGRRDCPGRP